LLQFSAMAVANGSRARNTVQITECHGIPVIPLEPEGLKAAGQQGHVAQLDLRSAMDSLSKTKWFAMNSVRTCEHFELSNDAACVEANGSVSSVNLLPVTTGTSRTIKRRFRRQRCRQRSRLLAQFPQLSPGEVQDW